jgi:DNA-binding transcriptional regulator YdaS (Cro superfamily)
MNKNPKFKRARPIDAAIDKAGGMRPLARAIGISFQAIQFWRKRIPAERVLDVERATGIPREELRPDLYAREAKSRRR